MQGPRTVPINLILAVSLERAGAGSNRMRAIPPAKCLDGLDRCSTATLTPVSRLTAAGQIKP